MFEIGLMFYTKDLSKDIEAMIARYVDRMKGGPVTIWYNSLVQPETLAGLRTKFVCIPKDHYVLAGQDA